MRSVHSRQTCNVIVVCTISWDCSHAKISMWLNICEKDTGTICVLELKDTIKRHKPCDGKLNCLHPPSLITTECFRVALTFAWFDLFEFNHKMAPQFVKRRRVTGQETHWWCSCFTGWLVWCLKKYKLLFSIHYSSSTFIECKLKCWALMTQNAVWVKKSFRRPLKSVLGCPPSVPAHDFSSQWVSKQHIRSLKTHKKQLLQSSLKSFLTLMLTLTMFWTIKDLPSPNPLSILSGGFSSPHFVNILMKTERKKEKKRDRS